MYNKKEANQRQRLAPLCERFIENRHWSEWRFSLFLLRFLFLSSWILKMKILPLHLKKSEKILMEPPPFYYVFAGDQLTAAAVLS